MTPSPPYPAISLPPDALARVQAELCRDLERQTRALSPLLTTMPESYGYAPPPSLTEADVRRIVREELDRPPSPLAVSAEDVRRWMVVAPPLANRAGRG